MSSDGWMHEREWCIEKMFNQKIVIIRRSGDGARLLCIEQCTNMSSMYYCSAEAVVWYADVYYLIGKDSSFLIVA